mmetsp:Transcript_14204/g.29067  ORF Transcript_14204/g.29067 Transcript_14204/m.29067 type:complete len:87 (+) Transcript_14204:2259-2519(+)
MSVGLEETSWCNDLDEGMVGKKVEFSQSSSGQDTVLAASTILASGVCFSAGPCYLDSSSNLLSWTPCPKSRLNILVRGKNLWRKKF